MSNCRLRTSRHLYGLLPFELCPTTINGSFTRGGVYPCLLLPDTSFLLPHYSIVQLCWTSSHLTELTQSNTKRSVDSSTIHSHPFNAMSPCICNAMGHCMLCIMNATWTIQSTPLTECLRRSPHLHIPYIISFLSIYYAHIYQHQHTTCHSMFKQ